jgi:hypothetical protein
LKNNVMKNSAAENAIRLLYGFELLIMHDCADITRNSLVVAI